MNYNKNILMVVVLTLSLLPIPGRAIKPESVTEFTTITFEKKYTLDDAKIVFTFIHPSIYIKYINGNKSLEGELHNYYDLFLLEISEIHGNSKFSIYQFKSKLKIFIDGVPVQLKDFYDFNRIIKAAPFFSGVTLEFEATAQLSIIGYLLIPKYPNYDNMKSISIVYNDQNMTFNVVKINNIFQLMNK